MADPDAARLGYLHQYKATSGTAKGKTVYSNKRQDGSTYTPAPSQAVQTPRPSAYNPLNRSASGTANVNSGGNSRYYGISPELRNRLDATKDALAETSKKVVKVASVPVVVASSIPRAELHVLNQAIDKANETAAKVASAGINVTKAELNAYSDALTVANKAAAKAASVGYATAHKELTTLNDALTVANKAAGAVAAGPMAVAGTVVGTELTTLNDALTVANKAAAKVASAGVNVKKAELNAYIDALSAAKKAAGVIAVGPVAKAELFALNKALDEASQKANALASSNNVGIHKVGVAGAIGVSKFNRSAYDTEEKRSSSVDARKDAKDYERDIKVIRKARDDQRDNGGSDFTKGNLNVLSYNKADKMAKEARQYLKDKQKGVEPKHEGDRQVYNVAKGGGYGGTGPTGSSDGGGGGGTGNGAKDLKKSGGKGLDKVKNIHGKMKNAATGGSNSSFAPDPNGDNLTARFAKVFGPDAQAKLDEAIAAYNESGAGTITVTGTVGQYGYSYTLKDAKGNVFTKPDDIKTRLIGYTSASSANTTQYANDPNSATMATTMTRLQLAGSQSGGNMAGITRRIASAYTGGDQAKATDLITQAVLRNPNKIRIVNPGQPGSYIQVLKDDGSYTTDGDIVAKVVSNNVSIDGAKPVVYKQLTTEQKAVLSGANGMAVMNRLNYAMNTTGTDRLNQAIAKYNAKNDKDIRVHGTVGQPGFWLEVKTANGWTSGTNAVLNKLEPYSGARVPGPQVAPPPATPTAPPLGDPGSGQPPASDGSGGTDGAGDGDGASDGSTDGGNGGSGSSDRTQGADGTNGQNQSQKPDNKPKGSVDNGSKQNDKATADILSLSAAAQKSQALIGIELKQPSGQVAKKVDQKLYAAADHSQNNIISKNEAFRYASVANTDGQAGVSRVEAKSYNKALNVVDLNNDGKSGKKEAKALVNALDKNDDGKIGKKEADNAKQTLKAQIDSKNKKEANLAQQYLNKANNKSGGTQEVLDQAAALVNAQPAKPKKQDNDGPGKKKNKKN